MEEERSLLTLAQIPWMTKYVLGIQAKLGDNITADLDGGLTIKEDTPEDQLLGAAAFLKDTAEKSSQIIRVLNRWIGDLINWYAAKHHITTGEAIEALQLTESTKRTMGRLKKIAKIVAGLPPNVLALENLTFSHFDTVMSFAGPKEPNEIREWNVAVEQILIDAAKAPEDRGRQWVSQSMRELQKRFNITPSRPVSANVLLDSYSRLCYILDHWSEDQYEASGHTRAKMVDWRQTVENELLERQIMTMPDPANFVAPWLDVFKGEEGEDADLEEDVEEGPPVIDGTSTVMKDADLSVVPQEEDDDLLPLE